ncbi:hypothetical protein SLS62_006851 [Diatrype stigma]|uniref:HMG box domain-containing protein n=1 Tax=Diatrype stigma TaxID=117547 RepID=A0AAN9UQP5_9PEZI
MARPKKADAKQPQPAPVPQAMAPMPVQQPLQMAPQPQLAPVAPPPGSLPGVPTRSVDVDQFIRVRDSVHTRFATILGLMKNFSDDFLRQTNLLIGEPTPFDNGGGPHLSAMIAGLDGIANQLNDLAPQVEEKKERKKRQHDPNAPKRPLTPYFLYMQTARPIIANDLGADAPKGAVQEEGQRRWAAMTPAEKTAWNNAYQFNLRLYNARVQSYKAGNVDARAMTDSEALAYADTNGIPQPVLSGEEALPPPNDQDAIAEQLALATAPAPPTPIQDTPKPKQTRKRKSAAADVDDVEASAAKTATPASPDKKRKRASKVAETPIEEPKKSSRKKKN